MDALRRGVYLTGNGTSTVALDVSRFETEYLVNVTIGGQDFTVIVDTGSVDMWVVQRGFNCVDANGTSVPQSVCAFGTDGFDTNASTTFESFPDVRANLRFGNGVVLNGSVGFDTVTVGGVSVSHQEFAVPDSIAGLSGNGILSGLLGLAFPSLTAVHNITDGTRALYNPFFFTPVKQKKLKNSIFSVSIDRGTIEGRGNNPVEHNVGFLSFGGMPPVPVVNTSVTVPIQGYTIVNSTGIPSDGGITCETIMVTASNNTILDSGTTFNLLPDDVAAVFATGFNPPATLITSPLNDRPIYIVDCNATAPEFQVTLRGKRFSIDPRDQIVASGKFDNGTIACASGMQPISAISPGFDTQFILGDVFLHNVVSTFNPIDREVTLTQRAEY
ncbi:acid protease [Mycena olivaceomarginata]|nr:acid protease [Mycena olivaceomarginata]